MSELSKLRDFVGLLEKYGIDLIAKHLSVDISQGGVDVRCAPSRHDFFVFGDYEDLSISEADAYLGNFVRYGNFDKYWITRYANETGLPLPKIEAWWYWAGCGYRCTGSTRDGDRCRNGTTSERCGPDDFVGGQIDRCFSHKESSIEKDARLSEAQ